MTKSRIFYTEVFAGNEKKIVGFLNSQPDSCPGKLPQAPERHGTRFK
jgi:hypothetical protein